MPTWWPQSKLRSVPFARFARETSNHEHSDEGVHPDARSLVTPFSYENKEKSVKFLRSKGP
jgi:hypothetical protein